MELPKLGPTGKKIAIGAATAGVVTLAAFTISKKAEEKRVLAAEGAYDKKYPFSTNCTEMKIILDNSKLELVKLQSESSGDAGAKRIRTRNIDALTKRISEIEKYYATLDCANQVIVSETPTQSEQSKGMSQYIWYGVAAIAAIILFTNLNKKD